MHAPPRPRKSRRPVHPAQVAREREGNVIRVRPLADVSHTIHVRLRENANLGGSK